MVDIVQIKKRTNKDAIQMLQEYIVLIESGRVIDIALAFVTDEHSIGYEASMGEQGILLSAAIHQADKQFDPTS